MGTRPVRWHPLEDPPGSLWRTSKLGGRYNDALSSLGHRDAADGCQWDTLAPHLTGRHVYMATPP